MRVVSICLRGMRHPRSDGLRLVAHAFDALTLTAPVFLLSILFLTAVALHFSVRLTRLSRDASALARELALLREERDGDHVRDA